jgi:hypothetical protein
MPEWDDEDEDTNLVKDLRKQLKAVKDAKAELDKELSTLRPQVRSSSLKSVLSEIGANPKIAALLPQDLDPTKDAVEKWLDEYGDLFNLKPEEKPAVQATEDKDKPETAPAGQNTVITPEIMEQWARMQGGDSANGATTPDVEKQQVAHLGQAVAASGGNFDSFVALLRGDKPLPS